MHSIQNQRGQSTLSVVDEVSASREKPVDKTDTNYPNKPEGIANSSQTFPQARKGSTSGQPSSGLYVNPPTEIKGPYQADRQNELERMTKDSSFKERFVSVKTNFMQPKAEVLIPAVVDRSQRMQELAALITERNQAMDEENY